MEKKIQQEKDKSKPVFYDSKGRRKKAFSWFLCISIVSISIVFYFFFQSIFSTPEIPNMNSSVKQDTKLVPINQKLSDEQLKKEEFKPNTEMKNDENLVNATGDSKQTKEVYGFYVNWDENSTASLKENIDSLTTLVPEWYHLKEDLTISSEIKPEIVKLAEKNHVKIMPLLTNYTEKASDPDSELIHKLLNSPDHVKIKFINDLVKQVEKNQFSGINIDFEAIPESDRENLTNFMKELTTVFHKHHLLVTQDVPANDKAFDYGALAKVIDRMIVMMYDEHYGAGVPGPIASNKWFEHTLNELNIPSEKLIVAFGNYGYDWEVNSKEPAKSVTFSEVMTMAQDSNIKIQWDKISGNPYFRYKTGETEHTTWFLDGVTLYNQVKIAMNNNAKGFALWRLGAEDPTIWKALKNPIEVQKNPDALHKIDSLDEVNYSGQGEILQVENERHNGLRDFKVDENGYFTDEVYQSLPSAYEVQRYGKPKGKQVALTFDDGPDP
ncbi:glycosyl hydrolase family 18 protein, partial [Bacillus proteolyticus]|uniref:glycosyl hydrolase family 18 protein n=1 Tax=Bacillus proteolyticus TaxID=2026192 RepID=UPI000AC1F23E